ncbi:leucine-rich repeat protein [Gordonibacter sp.]
MDDEALKGCPSLKHVQISPRNEGFSSFDDMVFTKDYSKLLLVPEGKEGAAHIPDETNSVPALGISRCPGLLAVEVGEGGAAFSSYNGMLFSKDMKMLVAVPAGRGTSVAIPAEVETIAAGALAGIKNLASITALGTVHDIDPSAFVDEVKAKAVVAIPAGRDYDIRKAVWEQAGFQNFAEPAKPGATVQPDLTANPDATSGFAFTLLEDFTLSVSWQGKEDPSADLDIPAFAEVNGVPYGVSTIAENAFANRGSLTSVKLPTTITSISTAAFAGCANLATIEFPNSLRSIGERAFEATSLRDIWLPTCIESIGARCFAFCESLERIVAFGIPEVANDVFTGCSNVSMYVPTGSENSWNPGLPSENNHLLPYGIALSEEPLTIEAGQEADLLEGGNLQAPNPVKASYSYAAAPLSVDAGRVSAKKKGTTDVTTVLTLDNVELTRASRTVDVSPNPEGEPDIALLNSEVPLPSVYLSDAGATQISVVAPFAVTFGQDAPYDVVKNPTSIESTALFKNNSEAPVRLAQVDCGHLAASTYLLANDGAESLDKQKLFSLYPQGAPGEALDFGYGANISTLSPTNKDAFLIPSGTSASYCFRLNLEDATVNPGAADNGTTTRPLASVICTFERYTESFYLKDNNTGTIYTLAQVKEHANDLAENQSASPYWNQYMGYINNDNSYVCQTVWDDSTYDVRVIGINHDELSEPIGGRTVAGLTFQFKNLLNESYAMNSELDGENPTNAGGWGASELRARMNPGIDENIAYGSDDNAIWRQVPIDLQDNIVKVKKKFSRSSAGGAGDVAISDDKLFLATHYEYSGTVYKDWGGYSWLFQEGPRYEYYTTLGVVDDWDGDDRLKKQSQKNVAITPSAGVIWWERSVYPGFSTRFLCVNSFGGPSGGKGASTSYGVCPCFCL